MHRTLSSRLLPLLLGSLLTLGSLCVAAQEAGVQIRGPKSSDTSVIKQYGPITNADTLWKIALMVRPDPRFSVYQVMQALYLKNPQAFKENNLNHLVNGQYLKVPSYDEIAAIDPVQAQAKSDNDDSIWEKKVKAAPKVVAKKAAPANVVQKQDLEQAKSEINQQLEDIGKSQVQRLETIQNDVLDSIDGLQALLQEDEKLKQRLSNFGQQLGEMQQQVAKGDEIKAQMDSQIKLLQELLDKANAREQELMLEKQKAALEESSFMSSIWFTILVATVPAVLVVSLIAFFLMRRKNSGEESKTEQAAPVAEKAAETPAVADAPADELALDGELSLDDELAIDLAEDDELSDLGEADLGGDELFSDDLDDLDDELLDDDVIHLDDDLDDLEDISLDDLGDDQPLDDTTELAGDDIDDMLDQTADSDEGEVLDGGELGQDMLDDLLGGLSTDKDEEETPANTEDDIDALLSEVNDVVEGKKQPEAKDEQAGESEEVADPDDIDALLDGVADEQASEEVADPDDIDALLDGVADEQASEEVADPDDIDALLDGVADEQASEEVADPDDIDALLDGVADEVADEQASEEVADPDDIDALLDGVVDEQASEEVADPDDIDALLDGVADEQASEEVADPDDIDALLDGVADEQASEEVADPDDIDALLDGVADEQASEEVADPDDIDALLDGVADEQVSEEVADPDDIDALLDGVANEQASEEVAEPEDIDALIDEIALESEQPANASVELTDPNDIDALLSTFDEPMPANTADDNQPIEEVASDTAQVGSHSQDIENFTQETVGQFLTMDFSDIGAAETDANETEVASDELDTAEPEDQEVLDVDDILESIQVEEVEQPNQDEIDDLLDLGDELDDSSLDEQSTEQDDLDDDEELNIDELLAQVAAEDSQAEDDLINDVAEQIEEVESPFDESTLANLLSEGAVPENQEPIELTPDFTDSNVLADLLSDGEPQPKEEVAEASEIEDIQELNNLDFDELLANIEEENKPSNSEEPVVEDVISDLDIGDDLVALDEEDQEPADFVSVDSLLSESLDSENEEQYRKENIDVGLDEFPEFAGDDTDIDDEDSNGVAAKLDLAKVYIEIGDEENAEVILQDVIKLGDAQQQFEAQQLLDNLN
ncbi:hypothetical protein LP316_13400 [Thalassotalea sp. LPB0316]|uniref:FimV/HubP family polar landmark protein n=1 Tax=Thalassotalea sp. LPB0316 TaxID=2769490 RepID=UPI00186767A1|nr:FimV/HubP family polar landmark protein [Thalassotalea sp. LPB0316]QOL25280.1 hypothetical protein LP316_13400 [Thalassotalea sp. LPB0316]